jgi:2-keto-4-pentenoate hydratase
LVGSFELHWQIEEFTAMSDKPLRLAALLFDAYKSGTRLRQLPDDLRLQSAEEGLEAQAELERRIAKPIGAWKVGIPFGRTPYHGAIFQDVIAKAPATFKIPLSNDPATQVITMAEGEIAFTLGASLPPRDRPYTPAEVIGAVDSACIAIEILQSRLPDFLAAPTAERVADGLGNGGFIIGEPIRNWQSLDRTKLHAGMTINGKVAVDHVVGKKGLLDPVALLEWLANNTAHRGGLKAGQVVTTGTWTGTHVVHPGDLVIARIAGLGAIETHFTS